MQSLCWGWTGASPPRGAACRPQLSRGLVRAASRRVRRYEAGVRFPLLRGCCFPTSSKGLRAECRWVSSPSRGCHLDITMVIILPETKIKGRTGWTEGVAANSGVEAERWGAWRLPGSSRSCPEEGAVEKERTAGEPPGLKSPRTPRQSEASVWFLRGLGGSLFFLQPQSCLVSLCPGRRGTGDL